MGMYDTIAVPCPTCGEVSEFQTKSGRCALETYTLDNAPSEALLDVNRHGPKDCPCGTVFDVELTIQKPVRHVWGKTRVLSKS